MEQRKVEFIPSAFRHNVTAADIRWAMVFHAMKCRKKWRVELGIEE
jgi:hypothetical protein